MSPMGIRLSPVGVAVFCLLGLGVIYHLYAGVISSRITAFRQRKTVDLRDLLALSVEAAVQGGMEVKRVREKNTLEERTKGKTKEGASEKLTLGDLYSHKKMYYLIKNTFPELTVNSEEHDNTVDELAVWTRDIPDDILQEVRPGNEVPVESVTVWIDPLDATQEYTENLVKYVTTMVCVAVDGKPVIGVIHKPFTGYTAWGLVGQTSNLKPRSSYNAASPRVIVSRSHSGKVKSFIEDTFGNNTAIIPAGGADEDEQVVFATNSLQRRKKGLAGLRPAQQKAKPGLQISLPQDFRQISSIIDVDILPETHRRVRLHKHGSHKPLGFYIRDGVSVRVTPQGVEKVPGVFISRLVRGGLAENTGLLGVNDEILEVNGIDVGGKSLDQVTDMMVANSHNLIVTVKPANQRNNVVHRGSKASVANSSSGSVGSAVSRDSAPSPSSQSVSHSHYSNSNSVAEGDSDEDGDLIIENDGLPSYVPHAVSNGNGSHGESPSASSPGQGPLPQSVSLPSTVSLSDSKASLSSLTTPTQNGSPARTSSSQESMREDGNIITL